jgi:hypothetical protein
MVLSSETHTTYATAWYSHIAPSGQRNVALVAGRSAKLSVSDLNDDGSGSGEDDSGSSRSRAVSGARSTADDDPERDNAQLIADAAALRSRLLSLDEEVRYC